MEPKFGRRWQSDLLRAALKALAKGADEAAKARRVFPRKAAEEFGFDAANVGGEGGVFLFAPGGQEEVPETAIFI